jgi:formylglycine-generating enzyme required for sulfatase activity
LGLGKEKLNRRRGLGKERFSMGPILQFIRIALCGLVLIVSGCANSNLHRKIDQNPALTPDEKAYAKRYYDILVVRSGYLKELSVKMALMDSKEPYSHDTQMYHTTEYQKWGIGDGPYTLDEVAYLNQIDRMAPMWENYQKKYSRIDMNHLNKKTQLLLQAVHEQYGSGPINVRKEMIKNHGLSRDAAQYCDAYFVLTGHDELTDREWLAISLSDGEPNADSVTPEFTPARPSDDGESNEKLVHTVKITHGFYMGIYEVTQEQYEKVTGSNNSESKGSNLPIEMVSWNEAVKFCTKLAQSEGKLYRLPTEAEWEYACRAGSAGKYCFGDDDNRLKGYAWYSGNSGGKTHPVGEKTKNAFGLYDMHGNVLEWCQDWYASDWYSKASEEKRWNDSYGDKNRRVIRGGSYSSGPAGCRSASRDYLAPDIRIYNVGFRLVLELSQDNPDFSVEKASTRTVIPVSEPKEKMTKPTPLPVSVGIKPLPMNPQVGTIFVNSIGMKLVFIPPGTFQMGSNDGASDEKPVH